MKKSENKSKTSSKNSGSGILIIFSAPSGCGKTTIVDRLLKRHGDWVRSVSVTTRTPRSGEKDGEDYRFVTPKQFSEMEAGGELLESAKVFDQWYGTPKRFVLEALESGREVILAIDVQGAKKIRQGIGREAALLSFFILPPSIKALRDRLEARGTESAGEIERRMDVAQDEIKDAGSYDHAVVNQNLDQTILEVEEMIQDFKNKRSKKNNALHLS